MTTFSKTSIGTWGTSLGLDYVSVSATGEALNGTSFNDHIQGGSGVDTIHGFGGNDYLGGGAGGDYLEGGTGDDTLDGGIGNDALDGSEGDDTLTGGADADLFVFDRYGGMDTITDFNRADGDKISLVRFGEFYSFSEFLNSQDVSITQNGADTVISFGYGNGLVLKDVASDSLTADDFYFWQPSTGKSATDDVKVGGAGDDQLAGGKGNDTLIGGAGNDQMWGGRDDDTFVIGTGDGNDTIYDFQVTTGDKIDLTAMDGVSGLSDLVISQDGPDTVISFNDGGSLVLSSVDSATLTGDEFVFGPAPAAAEAPVDEAPVDEAPAEEALMDDAPIELAVFDADGNMVVDLVDWQGDLALELLVEEQPAFADMTEVMPTDEAIDPSLSVNFLSQWELM
jgi:Ca2+-binding RTX toxin-like protein